MEHDMARIDDATIYNPYGWRLADLDDPTTSPERRRELLDDLVVWEAEELAHGFRHVTIVHGDPDDLDASRHLSEFYDTIRVLAEDTGWVRVRGSLEYVTLTVGGVDADDRLEAFAAAARSADRGEWEITAAAYPPGVAS
jgi:hypothetical protein